MRFINVLLTYLLTYLLTTFPGKEASAPLPMPAGAYTHVQVIKSNTEIPITSPRIVRFC